MTLNFSDYPDYRPYRTLQLLDQPLVGFDVYALQTALEAMSTTPLAADGVFGPATGKALRFAQRHCAVVIDGKAGPATQQAITLRLARDARAKHKLPWGLLRGQMGHESGFFLGNYSPQRSDGSYDAGVCQRNTKLTAASEGFNVPSSITVLAQVVHDYHLHFYGIPTEHRRWALAQGAWNAPAFASYLAMSEGAHVPKSETAKPTAAQTATLEAYIKSVSAYTRLSSSSTT